MTSQWFCSESHAHAGGRKLQSQQRISRWNGWNPRCRSDKKSVQARNLTTDPIDGLHGQASPGKGRKVQQLDECAGDPGVTYVKHAT
jgi:hypothetical protein